MTVRAMTPIVTLDVNDEGVRRHVLVVEEGLHPLAPLRGHRAIDLRRAGRVMVDDDET